MTRLIQLPDYLSPFRFKADWYQPKSPDEKFYGLIAVSRPVVDVTPRLVFQVSDETGAPKPNAACYHLFGNKYEVFETGGDGFVQFLLGAGSAYKPDFGESPNDRFYIGTEWRDREQEQPPAPPLSDVFYYGLPDQHHVDTAFSVRLMAQSVVPPPPPPSTSIDFGDVVKLLRNGVVLSSQIARLQAQWGILYSDLADAFDRLSKK